MNKDLMVKGLLFVAGAAVGSVVTWRFLKTKYEQITQEEIESVKEAFAAKKAVDESPRGTRADIAVDEAASEDEEMRDAVKEIIHDLGYDEKKEEEEEDDVEKPYVIPPEEFGDCDYIQVSLTYYLDGVVTNDQDKIVGNVDELIGKESLSHFGEYEDDSVFVRNDKLKMDFEILKDYREYSEIN